jgi:hypothetical protein
MVERGWDLEIRTSCFDPESVTRRIRVREGEDSPLYQVFLFLSGRDLPYVEFVEYVLHASFREPLRKVRRISNNPLCKLAVWAWGEFAMHTLVFLKNGERLNIRHEFQFSSEVEKAKRASPAIFEYE